MSPSLTLPWKARKSMEMDISNREAKKQEGTRDRRSGCSELATNFHLPLSFQSYAPEIWGLEPPGGQSHCPLPGFGVSNHGVMVVVISILLLP